MKVLVACEYSGIVREAFLKIRNIIRKLCCTHDFKIVRGTERNCWGGCEDNRPGCVGHWKEKCTICGKTRMVYITTGMGLNL